MHVGVLFKIDNAKSLDEAKDIASKILTEKSGLESISTAECKMNYEKFFKKFTNLLEKADPNNENEVYCTIRNISSNGFRLFVYTTNLNEFKEVGTSKFAELLNCACGSPIDSDILTGKFKIEWDPTCKNVIITFQVYGEFFWDYSDGIIESFWDGVDIKSRVFSNIGLKQNFSDMKDTLTNTFTYIMDNENLVSGFEGAELPDTFFNEESYYVVARVHI